VVEFVRHSPYHCVQGNHEQLLLEALAGSQPQGGTVNAINSQALYAWLYSGGQSTMASYRRDMPLLMEHVQWLRTLPLYIDLGDIWLVHAGLDPDQSVSDQTAEEFCWIRNVFHSNPNAYFADKLIITGHTITFTFPDISPGQLVEGPGWLDIDTGAYHPKSGWLTGVDIDNEQVYQFNVYDHGLRLRSLEESVNPYTRSRQRLGVQ
jgi:serine/threonine protein phosphatase 1